MHVFGDMLCALVNLPSATILKVLSKSLKVFGWAIRLHSKGSVVSALVLYGDICPFYNVRKNETASSGSTRRCITMKRHLNDTTVSLLGDLS